MYVEIKYTYDTNNTETGRKEIDTHCCKSLILYMKWYNIT